MESAAGLNNHPNMSSPITSSKAKSLDLIEYIRDKLVQNENSTDTHEKMGHVYDITQRAREELQLDQV